MLGVGVTPDWGTEAGEVDEDMTASVALVEASGAFVEDNEEIDDSSKDLAWDKKEVASLFFMNERQEVWSLRGETDTKKQDGDDNDDGAASRNMRASSSIDMDMRLALLGKRISVLTQPSLCRSVAPRSLRCSPWLPRRSLRSALLFFL